MQLYHLVLHDVFKIMITKVFYFDLIGKNFRIKKLSKNYVVEEEALRVEVKAIKKLLLLYP